ncbi:MAG: DNA-3-methyladenine glycosylase 2 family protein [Cyanothece sp. SIO1E1]|nr:DNA-3-methyladenine glycosylase 2 family protein [Cyanothece sp. SIO1E1]
MSYSVAIAHLKQSDPALAVLIDQVGPCHLDQSQHEGDLLYTLARTIIHQQLSIKVAATIHRRFLQLYPEKSAPSARDILNISDDRLRGAGISRPKIVYLKDLAQKVEAGIPTLAELERLDNPAIIKTLTQVKGIGPWSVQMLLIFRMHRLNVLPTEDLGVQTGIQKLYGLEERPKKRDVEALGQKWQPYGAIAAWYLWRSLDMDVWN